MPDLSGVGSVRALRCRADTTVGRSEDAVVTGSCSWRVEKGHGARRNAWSAWWRQRLA